MTKRKVGTTDEAAESSSSEDESSAKRAKPAASDDELPRTRADARVATVAEANTKMPPTSSVVILPNMNMMAMTPMMNTMAMPPQMMMMMHQPPHMMMTVQQHTQILSFVLCHQQASLQKQAHERDILKDMLKKEREAWKTERAAAQAERQALQEKVQSQDATIRRLQAKVDSSQAKQKRKVKDLKKQLEESKRGLFNKRAILEHDDDDDNGDNNAETTTDSEQQLTQQPPQSRLNQLDIRWNQAYQQLVEFKNQHGHTLVGRGDGNYSLNRWVRTQRSMFNKFQRGQNTHLTPRRIQLLKKIDFCWDPNANIPSWNQRVEHLKEYKQQFGHCNVPQLYKSQPAGLGEWVLVQRKNYMQGKMPQERIQTLEALGFTWRLKDKAGTLEQRIQYYSERRRQAEQRQAAQHRETDTSV